MAKAVSNRMNKLVEKAALLPEGIRTLFLSKIFGQIVPMVGTAGIRYEVVSPEKVVCTIKNKRAMQNHIKGVHAVAMVLLAETATGFITALNIPDDKIVLIKSAKIDYLRLSKGDMKAVATLSDEQRDYIINTPKGELLIPVVVTDETGQSPVECQMLWAWVPKKR